MKKRIQLFTIGLILAASANAQQLPLYTQIYHNAFLYNPSFTLMEDYSSVTAFYRNQWSQIGDAPVTRGVVFQTPLKSEKIGLGINLINDVNGLFNRTGGYMSYSYNIKLADEHNLLLGLSAGYMQNSLDLDGIDDPLVIAQSTNQPNSFDATFGIGYKWNGLQVGAAIPHLFDTDFNPFTDSTRNQIYVNRRHFLGSVSYDFAIGDKWVITPLVLARYTPHAGNPLLEGNLVVKYNEALWLAGNYRHGAFVGAGAGVIVSNRLNIGYSYDFTISDFAAYGGATHEITLGLKLAKVDDKMFDDGVGVDEDEENPWDADIEKLRRQVKDLNEQLEKQGDSLGNSIGDHEERIKALEEQKDSLNKIIQEEIKKELEKQEVGNASYDVRDPNNYNPGSTGGNQGGNNQDGGTNESGNQGGNYAGDENTTNGGNRGGTTGGETPGNNQGGTNYSVFQNSMVDDDPEAPYGRRADGSPIGKNERYDGPKYIMKNGELVKLTEQNKTTKFYNQQGELIEDINNHTGPVYDAENRLLDFVKNGGDDPSMYREYDRTELIDEGISYMAPGNYVIIGSFRSKDNAMRMRAQLQDEGMEDCGIVYNNIRRWFYVYALKTDDFDKSIQTSRDFRNNQYPDSWVHVILKR